MIGFTEEHTRQLAGNSSSPCADNMGAEAAVLDRVTCPNLRKGSVRYLCMAYMGLMMIPSVFEEENYCRGQSHRACVWFMAGAGEVTGEHEVVGSSVPGSGTRPVGLPAAEAR